MPVDNTTLYVLFVLLTATLIRSLLGFGEGLAALPLLALRIPITVAAPLAVLASIIVAIVIVLQDWQKIHVRSISRLVVSTLFGVPFGLLLLTTDKQSLVGGFLALIIMGFSAYALLGKAPPELKNDSRAWLVGCSFRAGMMGGAYGLNGPPLAIYGAMRRWSAQHFRATLQGYFLPASIIGMAGYALAGLWVPLVTHYYLLSLPLTLPAVLADRAGNNRLRGEAFFRLVHAALLVIGIVLLVQSIRG